MATNYYNVEMGVVDASGNLNVMYPITTSSNVAVGRNETLADRLTTINSNITSLTNRYICWSKIGSTDLKSYHLYTNHKESNTTCNGSNVLIWVSYTVHGKSDIKLSSSNFTFGVGFSDSSGDIEDAGITEAKIGSTLGGGPVYNITNRVRLMKTDETKEGAASGIWTGTYSGNEFRVLLFKGTWTECTLNYHVVIFKL